MPDNILLTKLHRPPVSTDHLHRPRLMAQLTEGIGRALTLVSAPAGYGKSTLLSCWFDDCPLPTAWLSLDDNDNDLATFLTYFSAAVQTVDDGALTSTRALLTASVLPSVSIITETLVADVSRLRQTFVVALDDYHLIQNPTIHELMTALLNFPRSPMHLALTTRRDPPLPLAVFRAKSRMTEIRVNDLRFSTAETAAFVEKCAGKPIAEGAAASLESKTEGWAVALRLAALTVRNDPDPERIVSNLPEDNQFVADYIITEVISHQPSEIQEYLLRTSLLQRFCAPLCDALCPSRELPDTCTIGGREFIQWLVDNNLFVIPLDSHNRWFRYHHLFQQLLRRRLEQQLREPEIRQIHLKAGKWFSAKDLLDEALHHCLAADDIEGAGRLVADARHELMNREQWHRMDLWMKQLPKDLVDNDIGLLIAKAWLLENRLRLAEFMEVVDRIEILLGSLEPTPDQGQWIEGEYNALKAAACYLRGNGPVSVSHARRSLDHIPKRHSSELAFALIVLALGLQMTGEGSHGRQVLLDALSEAGSHSLTYHARVLFGLCFIDWLEADMHGVRQTAEQVIVYGQEHELLESLSFGHYFMGLALYHLDDPAGAENLLRMAVQKGKFTNINTYAHASYLLALTHQVLGRPEAARQAAESVTAYSLKSHNTLLLQDAKAFQAELAVRQNRLPAAVHWAKHYDPFPLHPALRYYLPPLTLLKTRIAQNTPDSLQQAEELIDRLTKYYVSTHNSRVLVELHILQSLLCQSLKQRERALTALQDAIDLSRHGGYRRSFIDMGEALADLLAEIDRENPDDSFIGGIREAIGRSQAGDKATRPAALPVRPSAFPLAEPLSLREMEVLRLLAENLRDKEIATKLFISPATVKRHCANLYGKLEAKGRREAVERAHALGIL